jgi:Eukaryotic aspartyl protease
MASGNYLNRLDFSGQSLHPSLVLAPGPVRVLVLPIRHRLTFDLSITVPCDFSPSVSVYVGGMEVIIPPASFNLGPISTGSNTCLAGAASDESLTGSELASDNLSEDKANLGTGFWVVGDVFLRNVVSAWDVGGLRIGFADLALKS